MKSYSQEELQQIDLRISSLIRSINASIYWSSTFLKEHAHQRTALKLKEIRRELKKIKGTVLENPSSALYGESQVGKSYLVKNLLSKEGEPFLIHDRSSGEYYDFLAKINPRGDGVEATGVVTRFSTSVDIPDDRYPIKLQLLAPRDIVLLLCDTYFLDVINHKHLPGPDKIKTHLTELIRDYEGSSPVQEIFSEDDVYEIKEYFEQYFASFAAPFTDADFWGIIGNLIANVPYSSWKQVFSILWANNQFISDIFSLLIETLNRINFASAIYTEFDAILREHGALLHVARLKDLGGELTYEDTPDRSKFRERAEVIYPNVQGTFSQTALEKNKLSALISELILEVNSDLEQEKKFLRESDLLDFPGARSRDEHQEDKLGKTHVGDMVLRGKVSYIFNKYSSQYKISNLLFCNKNLKIEVTYIPRLLNSWIETYIGKDPKRREEFLAGSLFPPLFIIYTFFNQDLKFDANKESVNTLSEKWIKRFQTIFEREILTKNYDWHHNWTSSKPNFQNNYLLRDYLHSKEVFSGYDAIKKNKEKSVVDVGIPNYMERLKESFLDFEFVQKHFRNPEQTWEQSATLNKDGSNLIIENLTQVSNNKARTDKFKREIHRLQELVSDTMEQYYHNDDADEYIRIAARKAGEIHLNIDTVFSEDPYAFGNFIKAFLIKESACYNFYKQTLNSLELVEGKDLNPYILIRNSNPGLSNKREDYNANVNLLMETYQQRSEDELVTFFQKKGIDLNELFFGESNLIKSNSQILAESLRDYWYLNYLKTENFEQILNQGFPIESLEYLFENIKTAFDKLAVPTRIATSIRDFVDRYDQIEEAQEMIADISAAIINKFVTTMGWAYYDDEDIENVKKISQINQLNLSFDFSTDKLEDTDNKEIAALFDNMANYDTETQTLVIDPTVTKRFPNLYNIGKWRDQMKISFIYTCNSPTYDPLANQELGKIIEMIGEN